MSQIDWSANAKEIFDKVIGNLPQFHRTIAQKLVKESAEQLAKEKGAVAVEEEDLIKAFFMEVPPAFKEMMKRLFKQLGIDYQKYIEE
ncbi:MAG: DUF2621 family protein [Candidatus Omnitrophica bacterium]|nr:DUF2621 family protein [Candidatus Omnitrophota bacterium]